MRGYFVIMDQTRSENDAIVGIAATEEDLMDWSREYYANEDDLEYDPSDAYIDDPDIFVFQDIYGDVCTPGKDAFVIWDNTDGEDAVKGVSPTEEGIRDLLIECYEETWKDEGEDIDDMVDDIMADNNSDIWIEVAPVYDKSNKFNSSRRGLKKRYKLNCAASINDLVVVFSAPRDFDVKDIPGLKRGLSTLEAYVNKHLNVPGVECILELDDDVRSLRVYTKDILDSKLEPEIREQVITILDGILDNGRKQEKLGLDTYTVAQYKKQLKAKSSQASYMKNWLAAYKDVEQQIFDYAHNNSTILNDWYDLLINSIGRASLDEYTRFNLSKPELIEQYIDDRQQMPFPLYRLVPEFNEMYPDANIIFTDWD